MLRSLLCLPFLLLACIGRTDDVKTVTKKVPAIQDAPTEFPKKVKLEDVLKRWGVNAFWNVFDDGIHARLETPDLIAAQTDIKAKAKFLNEEERQSLWQEDLKKKWGDVIVISGWIQLNTASRKPESLDGDWQFFLLLDEGRRFQPSKIDLTEVRLSRGRYNNYWERVFLARFDNKDPNTGKPILTPETKELIFAVGGLPGSIKVRFQFDMKKKK